MTLGSVGREVGNRKAPVPEHLEEDEMTKKKKSGLPKELLMPNLIPDTPENIAKASMQGPPKEEWDYLNHPHGIVDNTPEEQQERIAKRDAELDTTKEEG